MMKTLTIKFPTKKSDIKRLTNGKIRTGFLLSIDNLFYGHLKNIYGFSYIQYIFITITIRSTIVFLVIFHFLTLWSGGLHTHSVV